MKTTLEFSDEERSEARQAVFATDLYVALWNAQEALVRLMNKPDYINVEALDDDQYQYVQGIVSEMGAALDMIEG